MNRIFSAIAALFIFSLFILPSCGSTSSSSTTGYDVNLTDTVTQHSLKPAAESFTISAGAPPSYDSALGTQTKQYATIVLKQIYHDTSTPYSDGYLGFAVGQYNTSGKLLFKLITTSTISSGLSENNKFKLPDTLNQPAVYTLGSGSASLLITQKAGFAPTHYTAAITSMTATITLLQKADTTASPAVPATYSVSFSGIPTSFSNSSGYTAQYTLSQIGVAAATVTTTTASN